MKRFVPAVPVLAATVFQLGLVSMAKAQDDLPDGKGKDVVEEVCGACHGTDLISSRRATKDGWSYIVDDMVSRGASATNDQIKTINDYLAKNFGQVNVNKAPSAEIASVLGITADQADAIVKYRMANGDFKTIDDLNKVPGLASANLAMKKDLIAYQ